MMKTLDLQQLGARYGTDKATTHAYLPIYEQLFARKQHLPVQLLEIGVWKGASLGMWSSWFDHPDARIVGVDVDDYNFRSSDPRVIFVHADINRYSHRGALDIVIDDGSHKPADIMAALSHLWAWLRPLGWYAIEDLNTQVTEPWANPDDPARPVLEWIATQARQVAEVHPDRECSEVHIVENLAILRKR